MIFKRLVRDLSEGSGVRIARALHRLERLGESLKNEEAPRLVRAHLIEAYRAGAMKTELAEAYIEEILRLVEEVGVTSIEEILHQVLHSRPGAAEHVEPTRVSEQRHDGVAASTAPRTGPSEITATDADTQHRSSDRAGTATETRSDQAALPVPLGAGTAENAQRLDKLLKAQKYLAAYRRLAEGMEKGEQELRILAEMDSDIQPEKAQPAVNG